MTGIADITGFLAAILTTIASVPQIVKSFRYRRTRDISLAANTTLAIGLFFWTTYGFAIGSIPIIVADSISLLFIAAIITLKLRFG